MRAQTEFILPAMGIPDWSCECSNEQSVSIKKNAGIAEEISGFVKGLYFMELSSGGFSP
jgi:hypothetical protein